MTEAMGSLEGMTPRQRIIIAALGLIAERGMAGVTMSAVAGDAGVARQTLYNHFPDVESIVLAGTGEHAAEAWDQLQRVVAAAAGPRAKLEQVVRYTVAASGHGAHAGWLEAGLSVEAQEKLHGHTRKARQLIAEILSAGVAEGTFRADLDIEVAASLIQHLLGTAGASVGETGDAARVATEAVKVVLGAVV